MRALIQNDRRCVLYFGSRHCEKDYLSTVETYHERNFKSAYGLLSRQISKIYVKALVEHQGETFIFDIVSETVVYRWIGQADAHRRVQETFIYSTGGQPSEKQATVILEADARKRYVVECWS
jgi:sulfite reductase alpha subunit-like flavoprotein